MKVGGRQGRAPANRKRLQSGTRSQHGGDLQGLSSDRGPESHEDAAGGREAVWIDGDTRDQSFSLLPPPGASELFTEITRFGGKGTPK